MNAIAMKFIPDGRRFCSESSLCRIKLYCLTSRVQIDVSNVFKDVNDNPVTVTVESNTNSSVAAVTVAENIMTITAKRFQ
jgi:hypothetical protein